MKRYRIQLHTSDECKTKGWKFEGQETRLRLWLVGMAMGVQYACNAINGGAYKIKFDISFSARSYFYVDCDSPVVMDQVAAHVTQYGCTVEELQPSILLSKEQMESRWCGLA